MSSVIELDLQKPILSVFIKISDAKTESLKIYPQSDVKKIAKEFVSQHKLVPSMQDFISSKIFKELSKINRLDQLKEKSRDKSKLKDQKARTKGRKQNKENEKDKKNKSKSKSPITRIPLVSLFQNQALKYQTEAVRGKRSSNNTRQSTKRVHDKASDKASEKANEEAKAIFDKLKNQDQAQLDVSKMDLAGFSDQFLKQLEKAFQGWDEPDFTNLTLQKFTNLIERKGHLRRLAELNRF